MDRKALKIYTRFRHYSQPPLAIHLRERPHPLSAEWTRDLLTKPTFWRLAIHAPTQEKDGSDALLSSGPNLGSNDPIFFMDLLDYGEQIRFPNFCFLSTLSCIPLSHCQVSIRFHTHISREPVSGKLIIDVLGKSGIVDLMIQVELVRTSEESRAECGKPRVGKWRKHRGRTLALQVL